MKILVDDVEVDASHLTAPGAAIRGAHIYAMTPNVDDRGYILLQVCKGEPDLLVTTSDKIELREGMRFLFVPRATFGG